MAREMQVMAWCDVHLADDEHVPMVASHTAILDGGKSRTLDLCEEHEAAMWKPLAGVVGLGALTEQVQPLPPPARVMAAGLPPRPGGSHARSSDGNTRTCLLCEATLEGRQVHNRHLVEAHGLPRPQALYGGLCPLCAHEFATPQGHATHGWGVHQQPDLAALFAAAKAAGDPHGLVAAARQRVVDLGGTIEPQAEVLSRSAMDRRRDDEVQVVAKGLAERGFKPGTSGITDAALDILQTHYQQAFSRSTVSDRIARAKRDGLL